MRSHLDNRLHAHDGAGVEQHLEVAAHHGQHQQHTRRAALYRLGDLPATSEQTSSQSTLNNYSQTSESGIGQTHTWIG